ncbi:unnamed protein product [Pleuronectes platessa]|uniref:Uncharacterized protein n=1 Tax=Pleuronectes platessa TaxID=8262 RepID=A0A9N7TRT9_PLEPL|nr:unnamed protein product [Pleuronectes platessa]
MHLVFHSGLHGTGLATSRQQQTGGSNTHYNINIRERKYTAAVADSGRAPRTSIALPHPAQTAPQILTFTPPNRFATPRPIVCNEQRGEKQRCCPLRQESSFSTCLPATRLGPRVPSQLDLRSWWVRQLLMDLVDRVTLREDKLGRIRELAKISS